MRKTNPHHKNLIVRLEKAFRRRKSKLWLNLREYILKSKRRKVIVNVSRISRYGIQEKIVVVPGKVLGAGRVEKKFRVAALNFSQMAKKKIEEAGGEILTLESLLEGPVEEKDLQIIR